MNIYLSYSGGKKTIEHLIFLLTLEIICLQRCHTLELMKRALHSEKRFHWFSVPEFNSLFERKKSVKKMFHKTKYCLAEKMLLHLSQC